MEKNEILLKKKILQESIDSLSSYYEVLIEKNKQILEETQILSQQKEKASKDKIQNLEAQVVSLTSKLEKTKLLCQQKDEAFNHQIQISEAQFSNFKDIITTKEKGEELAQQMKESFTHQIQLLEALSSKYKDILTVKEKEAQQNENLIRIQNELIQIYQSIFQSRENTIQSNKELLRLPIFNYNDNANLISNTDIS